MDRRFAVRRILFAAAICALSGALGLRMAEGQAATAQGSATAKTAVPGHMAEVFREGAEALHAGDLDLAEKRFRQVLGAEPRSAPAVANLGVVAMRRQHWGEAVRL